MLQGITASRSEPAHQYIDVSQQSGAQAGGHFQALHVLEHNAAITERTRAFVADGTAVLKVPGIIGLEAVRIGLTEIPLTEERLYATKDDHMKERVIEPIVKLDRLSDGTPVLLRSVLSNFGLWQSGETVYVTGEWEPEAAEATEKRGPGRPRGAA